ncbi:MAG: restriction endonuclease subunit S [Bacteroidales bacterium]|nr:restriction endonuclease subunit S [Candidatus Scybalousia scybalohippi]
MEGLEISEVLLSEVLKDNDTNRIDSEYFKKDFFNFFKNISNLEPLANFVEDGYRVVYENTEIVDSELGQRMNLPYFLQATDLETPFIRTDNLFYVNESEWNRYPKGRIKRGELLIEVKGKLEKVSIVPDDFPEKTLVSGSLFKLTVNERINKHVLLCYLICKYGIAFKDRYKTNLLISYISKSDLYRIPIPNFSLQFQNEIDRRFKSLYEKQKQSKSLYSEAEEILLSELGIKDWQPNNAQVNIKNLKDSFEASGRLDAEYYQTKYDKIETAITRYKNGYDIIGNLFAHNTEVCDYKESAYNYIEIGDVNIGDGSANFNLISTNELPDNAKRVLHKNDILISKVRPYRGAVAIIDFDDEKLIGSGAFTVLQENSTYKREVLQILLRTQIYKDWLLKWNVGSSYPVIKDEDILNLPIPILPMPIQETISAKIQESFALKAESKRLLEEAKMMVEREIEKGGK